MKIFRSIKKVRPLVLGLALLLPSWFLHAQQVIKFKNGQEETVKIIQRAGDTLRYRLVSEPNVERLVKIAEIDTIIQVKPFAIMELQNEDISKAYINKIEHYKKHSVAMGILIGVGVLVEGVAIYTFAYAGNHPHDNGGIVVIGYFVSLTGLGMIVPGAIILAQSKNKVKHYKTQLYGLTLGLKCSPGQAGLALRYNF